MSLSLLTTGELGLLRASLASGALGAPVTESRLSAVGLDRLHACLASLADLDAMASLRIIDAVLEERNAGHVSIDLVWTGPEAEHALTRDTAVVVRELFANAEQSVLVAGYSFDHGQDIFKPLHTAMEQRGVHTRILLDIQTSAKTEDDAQRDVDLYRYRFLTQNWPFGDPTPELYYDRRVLDPTVYSSLHAKFIVVDRKKTLITSANFTNRGQTRNLEVGVVIADAALASQLVGHCNELMDRNTLRTF